MRRARGCGGRFLNTKKLENNSTAANTTVQKGTTNSGATISLNTKSLSSNFSENADSSSEHCEAIQPRHMEEMHQTSKAYSDNNGNNFYLNHQGFQLSMYQFSGDSRLEGRDFSTKQRDRLIANEAHRALTIK